MNRFSLIASSFLFIALAACQNDQNSLTDFATQWSRDIKQKITEDANQQADKTTFDSANNNLTLYSRGKKLKYFHFKSTIDSSGKVNSLDTVVSIFYSPDQKFELVRELCPVIDRSFEGIRYKGEHVGLAEFRYCDGKIKEAGLRFNGEVGVWKKYDRNGNVIEETDKGNIERLENLKRIKYYR